ncbi:hypothetical protein B0H14DRAFT_229796 [Mycena olivaceomarginata]|nr:hypothetical protein B0H14DRAFT_229796 [Mycena olivaceomarginata]
MQFNFSVISALAALSLSRRWLLPSFRRGTSSTTRAMAKPSAMPAPSAPQRLVPLPAHVQTPRTMALSSHPKSSAQRTSSRLLTRLCIWTNDKRLLRRMRKMRTTDTFLCILQWKSILSSLTCSSPSTVHRVLHCQSIRRARLGRSAALLRSSHICR